MTITILDGSPENGKYSLESFVNDFRNALNRKGFILNFFDLKRLTIKNCMGCFGCWVKTPGECTISDDTVQIRRNVINSDLVIFISPVIMGFTSALLKKVQDKMIPLIHPYIEFVNNECHHQSRYNKNPDIALLLERTEGSDEEDYKIIENIYQRLAINMKSNLRFVSFTDQDIEKIIYEINSN